MNYPDFDFPCAHCGKQLSGNYLPTLCPSCGKEHTHRYTKTIFPGLSQELRLQCNVQSCRERIKISQLIGSDKV